MEIHARYGVRSLMPCALNEAKSQVSVRQPPSSFVAAGALFVTAMVSVIFSSSFTSILSAAPRSMFNNPDQTPDADDEPPLAHLTFLIAQHVILFADADDFQVIDKKRLEEIILKTAETNRVQPHFWMTRAGLSVEPEVKETFWPLYKDLYERGRCNGSSWGILSPRAAARWDRIRTAEDLKPDPSSVIEGNVFDKSNNPVTRAQVLLLPEKEMLSVYLRDGFVRNPLQEHLALTSQSGGFSISKEDHEHLIVALHPTGFAMGRISDLPENGTIQLRPWAKVAGQLTQTRFEEGGQDRVYELADFPLSMQSEVHGISFHIYETEIDKSGRFTQQFVPPGVVQVSRSFKLPNGSMSFPEASVNLVPGQTKNVEFGELTDEMRSLIELAWKKHDAAMK